ncbi:condensation domain-containing protein, partial [Mycolicibacterium hassiacum]|uniref:condensation domain-containing protein n=1 Tax=Mycolicibacterium hassiacum TaxID=46351 RepID=UPI0022EC1C48
MAAERPHMVRVTGIPRTGVAADVAVEQALSGGLSVRDALGSATARGAGVVPDQLYRLGARHGYRVAVTWGGQPGTVDAVFLADRSDAALSDLYRPADIGSYASEPKANTKVTAVRQWLAERLPDYMVPSQIMVLEEFPLTSSGKIDRRALPEPVFAKSVFRAPQTPTEKTVAEVFTEVLGLDRVGLDDDFFALGGDSLTAIRVCTRLQAALGRELQVRDLFDASGVGDLAARIDTRGGRVPARPPLAPQPRPAAVPLSYAQQRLWFVQQLQGASSVYNMAVALRLCGALDGDAVGAALADVVERHESLRTVFRAVDGVPQQVVIPATETNFGWRVVDAVGWSENELDCAINAVAEHNFDLAHEIPLRAGLFRTAAKEHVLVVVVHHIAADGWSIAPFVGDLATAYASRSCGQAPEWPPLPVQYVDYTLWQQDWLGASSDPDSVIARQLGYWEQALADLPERLDLPTDRPYPPVADYRGATVPVNWSAQLQRRINEVAREHNVTPFMVVQSALAIMLSTLTGSDDIPVGIASAGRDDPALDHLVGFFVNTLVLRVDTSGDPSITELLERVRRRSLEAFEHADVPFEVLVERLNPVRSLSRHPLVQVLLTWQNLPWHSSGPVAGLTLGGVEVSRLDLETRTARVDLVFSLAEQYDNAGDFAGIAGEVEFRTDVFDSTTIERLVGWLERAVEAVTEDTGAPVSSVNLLDPAELLQVAQLGNRSVLDVVVGGGDSIPDRFAVVVGR